MCTKHTKMKQSNKKVLVAQIGARHRYMIPRILYEHGLLAGLYTDAISSAPLRLLARIIPIESFKRLARRTIEPIPRRLVKYSFNLIIQEYLFSSHYDRARIKLFGLQKYFMRWTPKGEILYSMFIENLEFTKYCKSLGFKVVLDVYEDVRTYEDCIKEVQNFENIVSSAKYLVIYKNLLRLREEAIKEALDIADVILVPSDYVANGIEKVYRYNFHKVKKLPYGSSIVSEGLNRSPIEGTILWVGIDPFRKGLTYLTLAVNALNRAGFDLTIRVAGITDEEVIEDDFFRGVKFLGRLSKERMVEEYSACEMFVFPTISEGFAGVVIEACSMGVPVITSKNSGVEDDFPGILIEDPRNLEELMDSIKSLHQNKSAQNTMSKRISSYALNFSRESYASRLVDEIESI